MNKLVKYEKESKKQADRDALQGKPAASSAGSAAAASLRFGVSTLFSQAT